MNPDEVAYLAHFGVRGMKWGVHRSDNPLKSREMKKQINQDAKDLNRAMAGNTANSHKKDAVRKSIKAKEQKNPGYQKAVVKRAVKRQRRIIGVATLASAAATLESMVPGSNLKLAKLTAEVIINGSARAVKNGASYASAVHNGRQFAEKMGLDTPTIIDETGRIIKNARPNFG